MPSARELEAELLDAHARDDRRALVDLYAQAAEVAEAAKDIDRACFFLTHAWVFALETNHATTDHLRDRLVRHGRI